MNKSSQGISGHLEGDVLQKYLKDGEVQYLPLYLPHNPLKIWGISVSEKENRIFSFSDRNWRDIFTP